MRNSKEGKVEMISWKIKNELNNIEIVKDWKLDGRVYEKNIIIELENTR